MRLTRALLCAGVILACAACAGTATAAWTQKTVPIPTIETELEDVACASASFCMAVGGTSESGGNAISTVLTSTGSEWRLLSPVAPTETPHVRLVGVSCPTAANCTVVGTSLTLVENWNGREWTLETAVDPAEATAIELLGVACGSATVCTAVGRYADRAGVETMLSEKRS